jgi:acid phosphatase family membrane protein YuiD
MSYAIAPLVGWLVAGTLKSIINSIKFRKLQLDLVGYGGLPSTHTTIVCTTATLIAIREGVDTPAFAVATTVAILVMMDAVSFRQWVGGHAAALNRLSVNQPEHPRHRERIGHKPVEIAAGIALGILCAFMLDWWL